MTDRKPTLLVTGASGNLGRRVVELLLESGTENVIVTTRSPEKLADLAAKGVEVRIGDFDDRGALAASFEGADRLLLISTGTLHPAGARLAQHRAAVAAAIDAGVGHVVYTSAPAPHPTPGGSLIDDHFWTEQALAATDLDWTILRHHIYMDTLLGSVPNAVASGKLTSAAGNGARNYVTREDCARTDAAALASDWTGRRVLDVTGPAPVTQAEIAALASELTGHKVEYLSSSPDEMRNGLSQAGLPPFVIDAILGFDLQALQGYHAVVTPTVEALTGTRPTSVAEFLRGHRDALAKPA